MDDVRQVLKPCDLQNLEMLSVILISLGSSAR